MKAVGYVRVSTDEQARSGLGLEAQRAALAAYAEREGIALSLVVEDTEPKSSSKDASQRPRLLEAVGALEDGDSLIVMKLDRLGRGDRMQDVMIEHLVDRRGARIVSTTGEGTGDDSPTSIFLRRILAAVAELERLTIGARTSAALQAKKARGARLGRPPYGYRLVEGALVEDEDEQKGLSLIRKRRRAGDSLRAICDALRASGARPRDEGATWGPSTVSAILKGRAWLAVRSSDVK